MNKKEKDLLQYLATSRQSGAHSTQLRSKTDNETIYKLRQKELVQWAGDFMGTRQWHITEKGFQELAKVR